MSIQHSSGASSTDLPPSSAGTNLQSPSSQPAMAQPASVASGSSQHGASAGVLPSSQLVGPSGECLIYHYYYYYFVIIIVVAFGCIQAYFPSRTQYLFRLLHTTLLLSVVLPA